MRKILLSVALLPSLALASGYSLPNTNPRDLGLSASAVAAQRDSGAVFALPAALARLEGPSASVGFGLVNVFNTWTDPAPTPTPFSSNATEVDMETQFSPIGNVSLAYGGKLAALGNRGWGVGVSFQPFGGAIVDWPDDWPGRYRIDEVDRKAFSGALTAGIEVLPWLRVGGGLLYYYTMQEFTQYTLLPVPPTPIIAKATLDQDGGALSWDASIEIDPIPNVPFRIGVDYKHQAVQELDGDVTWENLPPGAALVNPILQNQDVEQTLTIPNLLNVGLAYRVIEPLLLTFTYTFDRWEVYESDTFRGSSGGTLAVARNYDNGHTIRAGAEYDVTPALQVRLGLQRDISGLDEREYSPTLPDASSWAVSAGATYRFGGAFSVTGGLFYANMDEVETEGAAPSEPSPNPAVPFRGTYEPSALVYGLTLGWNPGAR